MGKDGKLRLEIIDVYGQPINERVDILLRNLSLSENKVVRIKASTIIEVAGLRGAPEGLYRLEVQGSSYLPVSLFVNVHPARITKSRIILPIDPEKVLAARFPKYEALPSEVQRLLTNSDKTRGLEGKTGKDLYESLDDLPKACFLNIVAKCSVTPLGNGTKVISYLGATDQIRADRLTVIVPSELLEALSDSVYSGLVEPVSGGLHFPPVGFVQAGGFKTNDNYGNLQITLYSQGHDWIAELDIDDARGLEHVFQVVKRSLTQRPNHPYLIHEILVSHQKLDPGYRLITLGRGQA